MYIRCTANIEIIQQPLLILAFFNNKRWQIFPFQDLNLHNGEYPKKTEHRQEKG
jgi:hypothetical protein